MQSMELDDDDKIDEGISVAGKPVKPDYPWGLRITLTHREFEKLGIDPTEAEVGGIFHLHGLARITSIGGGENEGGKHLRVEAQIEDLSVECEDEENEDEDEADGK